jgi:hypothetical protein
MLLFVLLWNHFDTKQRATNLGFNLHHNCEQRMHFRGGLRMSFMSKNESRMKSIRPVVDAMGSLQFSLFSRDPLDISLTYCE